MLNRILLAAATAALALGVAKVWAARTKASIESEAKGLPADFHDLNPGQQKRAEKQRRKSAAREAKVTGK